MATIVYVDNDDEITSAAARIRTTDAGPVALVVPSGSRLSTSRINFRLLAREAQTHGRRLAIVAADGATRALAASAGLPVYGSVAEFESAGEGTASGGAAPVAPPTPVAPTPVPRARPGRRPPRVTPAAGVAPPAVIAAPAIVEPQRTVEPPRHPMAATAPTAVVPVAAPDRRRSLLGRPAIAVGLAALALAIVVVGVAGYLFLPSATITVTPRQDPIGPLSLPIRADPAVTTSDVAAGVVPAQRLSFDLAASDTFAVKGRRVEEKKATGKVTFSSYNTGSANTVPAGSIVSTEGGIQFRTRTAARLARAQLIPGAPRYIVIPSKATVVVDAVVAGTTGNVPANAITVVPRGEDPVLTRVSNADPTQGGVHNEFPRVDQADVDAAVTQLMKQLGQDFDTSLADPTRVPAGLTAFAETKLLSGPTPAVDPATLIGKEVESFDLVMTSTGSVVAVDESLVTALVGERIRGMVSAGSRLIEGSMQSELGVPTVDGQVVSFSVAVRAAQARVLVASDVLASVKGKPVPQARSALEPFGKVEISVWPDWVTSIPTIDGRVQVRIVVPGAPSSAAPAASAAPSPSGP